jgi:hypothetical protein
MASIRIVTATMSLLALTMCASASPAQSKANATGTVNRKGELLFHNHPLQPPVRAKSSLDIGRVFHMDGSDVVLVKDTGGTACPYLYYLVTIRGSTTEATPEFGSCTEVVSASQKDHSIVLTMHGYRGPFEPEPDRRKAARELRTFVFADGKVSELKAAPTGATK